MEYFVVTALISFISFSAAVQNGFYLAPETGAGLATSRRPLDAKDNNGSFSSYNRGVVFTYHVPGGVGYNINTGIFKAEYNG